MDITVTVKNTGPTVLSQPSPRIDLPQGWSVRPLSRFPETVEPAGEARATFSVTAPAGTPLTTYPARGHVSFTRGDDPATQSDGFSIEVGPDLTATDAGLSPNILEPGATGFAAVTLSNLQTSADRHVQVAATDLPAGWQERPAVQAVVPAGGQTTVLVPVSVSGTARSGTLGLSVTDAAGRILATSQTPARVRGSTNCSADPTGEACLPQSTLMLANFEAGAPTGWTAAGSSVDTGDPATEGGTGSFLGAAALRVKAVQPSPSHQWREVTYAPPGAISTADASALMVSLRLADPVPGAAYEAKLWARDSAGHTSEVIHRIAPGAWNQLVLPLPKTASRTCRSCGLRFVPPPRQTTPPASSSMRCKWNTVTADGISQAARRYQLAHRWRPAAGVPGTWWTPQATAPPRTADIEARRQGINGSSWISGTRGASVPCTFIP